MKSRKKKNLNRGKDFGIEKKISESRKLFQNREKSFRIEKCFVTRIEKKSWKKNLIVIFLRLYHNINISKRTLERRLSYYGFRKKGFSNVTINELKNAIEYEIQGPASMRDCCRLWHL